MDLTDSVLAGRYKVYGELCRGYYGITWGAFDLSTAKTGSKVCIKSFYEKDAGIKELTILRQLKNSHFQHSHLCQILNVAIEPQCVCDYSGMQLPPIRYVVFEYCDNLDLFNYLVTGPLETDEKVKSFSEPLACHYLTQLLLAVTYLHEKGVYHRDIKPENCLVDKDFNLKLTDFGTNKILPVRPNAVLRTMTRNTGTEYYRAPEVHCSSGYDPGYADIWSVGMTLFFFVSIDVMFAKCSKLEEYMRIAIAPLGILFPFPLHFPKLESCMMTGVQLWDKFRCDGSLKAGVPSNLEFWQQEWFDVYQHHSRELIDLFNRIFVFEPSCRITLRDIMKHQWLSVKRLNAEAICKEMESRCTSTDSTDSTLHKPLPQVVAHKLLGGVDQATLRQSLTRGDSDQYASDGEIWLLSNDILCLESCQEELVASDVMDVMITLQTAQKVFQDILQNPDRDDCRIMHMESWCKPATSAFKLFKCVGFLTMDDKLFLSTEDMDLTLLKYASGLLSAVEEAVARDAIPTCSQDVEWTYEDVTSQNENNTDLSSMEEATNFPVPYIGSLTSYSSYVSQDSTEEFDDDSPPSIIKHPNHMLVQLVTKCNLHQPMQFTAANEFCKLSGLLCSYGLYQVVNNEHLLLHCRGNSTSFSAHIIQLSDTSIGISSWCLVNSSPSLEEWHVILTRVEQDMKTMDACTATKI